MIMNDSNSSSGNNSDAIEGEQWTCLCATGIVAKSLV